ncbi:ubiquitin-conjugating enzyme E2 U-like isoform X2 [Tubulanus polymorphus]|uniref:ubiquitin-conjugating enzyme E2 U-like isoform X2 n=1 Tax=Tubulanus polymorphus TaxID=672921 RepID=UPI003DA1E31B
MYSRAHLLIERDFEKFKKDKPWGIDAHPLTDDNIFEWTAKIHGLSHTLWEGGIFRLYLKYNEHYNLQPPMVCFHTVPFHPNVDMITGKPCVEFLDDLNKWSSNFTIDYILVAMQTLLSNPVLDNAVNTEAVDMILNNPHAYKQMVLDCVAASRRVEAGLSPHLEREYSTVPFQAPTTPEPIKSNSNVHVPVKVSKMSFEDYHTVWSGIATSKPAESSKNVLLEDLHYKPHLQKVHLGIPFEEIQEQMAQQLDQHQTLMYGNFKTNKNDEQAKLEKINKLNQMRRIYLPKRTQAAGPTVAPEPTPRKLGQEEPWDKEVDDLVAWTANLNADAL